MLENTRSSVCPAPWNTLGIFLVLVSLFYSANIISASPPIEFCGNRTLDQQLGATKGGSHANAEGSCVPLIDKKEATSDENRVARERPREIRQIKVENLQSEAMAFLQKYNQFLECCKTDFAELKIVEELGNEVGDLLTAAQDGLFSEHMKIRGWTLSELIPPVAKARADLKILRAKLELLGEIQQKVGELGSEYTSREAAQLSEIEESIENDIKPRRLPTGPKTGTRIGTSPAVGSAIGITPKTGAQIGAEGAVGADLGMTPKTGRDIGATGPTGFEIGATGKAGADIGDSRLNTDLSTVGSSLQQSTVHSNLSDTTVGSNFGRSNISSSLGDTSVDSSLEKSGVGSSLQNRGTGPQP